MFQLKQTDTFLWPVKIATANEKGDVVKSEFRAIFKRLPVAEVDNMISLGNDLAGVNKVLVGWHDDDVKDEHGQTVPFNPQSVAQLLQVAGMTGSIMRAYFDGLHGIERKN